MRRMFTRIGSVAAIAMLSVTLAQPTMAAPVQTHGATHGVTVAAQRSVDQPAYFEMTDYSRQIFVVKLTKDEDIQHARDLLSGATDERPHLIGRIDKRTASYNPSYDFHVDPATVGFFDYAIEVCDATIPYVNDHLDEVGGPFLPGRVWCDWSSRLVREIPAPQ